MLHINEEAERTYARLISNLRSARQELHVSQNTLSSNLPVRGRAISEWETGAIEPTMNHLILWSDSVRLRLEIVERDNVVLNRPIHHRAGESWLIFERRRLADPLKHRRVATGLAQEHLSHLIGVSRDSVSRWESARVPYRPMALVVWAQVLGYSVALRPTTAALGGNS